MVLVLMFGVWDMLVDLSELIWGFLVLVRLFNVGLNCRVDLVNFLILIDGLGVGI